jgi:hypothetical protein
MSRDSGAHGVQVVGGSNPPCPTNSNPNRINGSPHHSPLRGERFASNVASSSGLFTKVRLSISQLLAWFPITANSGGRRFGEEAGEYDLGEVHRAIERPPFLERPAGRRVALRPQGTATTLVPSDRRQEAVMNGGETTVPTSPWTYSFVSR